MLGTAVSRLSLLLVTAGMTVPLHAALIEGAFSFNGTLRVISPRDFDFFPLGAGQGNFITGAGGFAGDFIGSELTGGTVKDVMGPDPGPVNIPNFITLKAFPTYAFTATNINAGIFGSGACNAPAAKGQTCTIPGGLGNFTNLTATSSQASFAFTGTVSDGSGDPPSDFLVTFTATFSDKSYQKVFSEVAAKKFIDTSFAADVFVFPPQSQVPEPASVLGVGCGLAALGLLGRRFRQS